MHTYMRENNGSQLSILRRLCIFFNDHLVLVCQTVVLTHPKLSILQRHDKKLSQKGNSPPAPWKQPQVAFSFVNSPRILSYQTSHISYLYSYIHIHIEIWIYQSQRSTASTPATCTAQPQLCNQAEAPHLLSSDLLVSHTMQCRSFVI